MKTDPRTRTAPSSDPLDHDSTHLPIALMVAPRTGRLRILTPRSFRNGREWLEAGQPVAEIHNGGRPHLIVAPARGSLGGVLGADGELVETGQLVAWMEPG